MTRTVLNIDLNQIAWMRTRLDCKSNEALRLLQLYGYLEHVSSGGNAVQFKQSVYAEKTGFTRDTVQKDLQTLAKNRWAEVHGVAKGTEIAVMRIPFDVEPLDMSSPSTCRASRQLDAELVDIEVSSYSTTSKKGFNNSSKEEEEGPTSSKLKEELIQTWNDHKPSSWPALKAISPPRDKSVRALGGYRVLIDLLPDALRGARASKFWNAKAFTWENFIGDKRLKGHVQALAESAPSSSSSNRASYPAEEHPDFFPPCPVSGDMRPKHGFTDSDQRQEALESARAFYSQLSEG